MMGPFSPEKRGLISWNFHKFAEDLCKVNKNNMRTLVIGILVSFSFLSNGQITFQIKGVVDKKISTKLSEGSNVELKLVFRDASQMARAQVAGDGFEEVIPTSYLSRISFRPLSTREFWQSQVIAFNAFDNIIKYGMQFDLRHEIDIDAIELVNYLSSNRLLFDDAYLESYLYSVVYRIYPEKLNDGRLGLINIKVIKDLRPNAFIFPNGSLFISTGLLSVIQSEEELIAVLAHEISHFILDHSIANINKTAQRQKRVEFWAAVATGAAAITDAYVASKNENYIPGALTLGTAIVAMAVTEGVNKRFGLQYSREQEFEADIAARNLMIYIGVDPTALSSVLAKIKDYFVVTGNFSALSGEGTHPEIDDRIGRIGFPSKEFADEKYDRIVSLVNTFNSFVEFESQHFQRSAELASRNVRANVATEEDYLILAIVTLYMFDNQEMNSKALSWIQKGKQKNVYPVIYLPKYEGILYLRLGSKVEAKESFLKYKKNIEGDVANLEKMKGGSEWSQRHRFLHRELEWVVKMINKVDEL